MVMKPIIYLLNLPFALLPTSLHRSLTNWHYFMERLSYFFIRPIRLYFDSRLREEWMLSMVEDGKEKQILNEEEAQQIRDQIKEPYIQKYLKSLAVHICTLPVTQIISVMIATIYILTHPELPRAQAWGIGLGIIALFQIIPISPGSLVRGLYVVYLVIREKDFKNYNIAVFLGFFKYIGYLAFPIQMTYHYPTLARFMAGHWATEAVHIIPVFGEKGALLEHWVFGLFYNWPLTLKRQFIERTDLRKKMKPVYWHLPLLVIIATGILSGSTYIFLNYNGFVPEIRQILVMGSVTPLVMGTFVNTASCGTTFSTRIKLSILFAISIAVTTSGLNVILGFSGDLLIDGLWKLFIFIIFSLIGTIGIEFFLGEPETYRAGK